QTGRPLTLDAAPDAREILASATLTSDVGDDNLMELTVGFENARVNREASTDALPPATDVASVGRRFGIEDPFRSDANLLQVYTRGTFQFVTDEHRFEVGAWFSHRNYDL